METTELTYFEPRRKPSEPKDIKAPMVSTLMWLASVNGIKYEVMGSESFRVVSKESPIKELK